MVGTSNSGAKVKEREGEREKGGSGNETLREGLKERASRRRGVKGRGMPALEGCQRYMVVVRQRRGVTRGRAGDVRNRNINTRQGYLGLLRPTGWRGGRRGRVN